ncbi:MAG TPA: GNAT family N-acetyltransferase [Edaphobacter sp.]
MLIRAAQPGDEMGVADVHVRSWQAAYKGLLPDDYLNGLRPEQRAQRYTFGSHDLRQPFTIVSTEASLITGFATISPARDPDIPDHGELCALYVAPEWWGCGIGAALVSEARDLLHERGFRSAALWVMANNTRAERFYRIDQWMPDGLRRTDTVWGIVVDEIRYRRVLDMPGTART